MRGEEEAPIRSSKSKKGILWLCKTEEGFKLVSFLAQVLKGHEAQVIKAYMPQFGCASLFMADYLQLNVLD